MTAPWRRLDRTGRWLLAGLAVLTLLRLVVAATTPLSPDEAYYWVWSRAPATGYLDHPPMVAWFVACGTAIAGDTPLGVRLLAPLAAAAGSLVLARAANRLFPATRPGAAAALLLNATLMFGIGSVTMTPDTPLLLFWTGAVAVLAEMARRAGPAVPVGGTGRGKRPETVWRLGTLWRLGIAVGLALLSKYTAVLLAPAVLAWLAAPRNRRRWLADVRLWAAGVLALVLFAPVLVWNAEHGWASFAKQGGRTGDWNPGRAAQFLGELAGGQFGLATPLIAVLCTAGTVAMARRWREPACGLVAALTLVPAAVFAEHALGDRVQANWPAIVYPSAAVAAACLGGAWRRLRAPAVVLGFALTALVWLQGVAAPFPLPRSVDPTLARLGGWAALADAIAVRARRDGAAFVAADNYGQASLLAMLLPPSLPVLGVEDRWRFFNLPNAASPNAASPNAASPNAASPGAASPGAASPGAADSGGGRPDAQWPGIAGQRGLLVQSARRSEPPDAAAWSAIEPDGSDATIVRTRDGVTAETYRLYRVTGAAIAAGATPAPAAILPRPRTAGVPP